MLVKIVKNGMESEWFELTKQRHRALLEDAPEAAITLIDNLYANSPDSGTYVKLDFSDDISVRDIQSRVMSLSRFSVGLHERENDLSLILGKNRDKERSYPATE